MLGDMGLDALFSIPSALDAGREGCALPVGTVGLGVLVDRDNRVVPDRARWVEVTERDRFAARGEGMPGRLGSGLFEVDAELTDLKLTAVSTSGESGSGRRASWVRIGFCRVGGVSSASETMTQPLGLRNVVPDLSASIGV